MYASYNERFDDMDRLDFLKNFKERFWEWEWMIKYIGLIEDGSDSTIQLDSTQQILTSYN